MDKLFTVEYDDGEMVDSMGEGGFSVFTSYGEALDLKQNEESSGAVGLRIVEWARRTPDIP